MDVETAAPQHSTAPKFKRTLGGFAVIVLTLSVLSPGVSIFVSGGTIIQQAGSGAIAAFLLGSFINYFQISMAAELGSAYPTSGFDYAAMGHAIGDWAGATNYIACLFSLPIFLNTSAIGIAIYMRPLFPTLSIDAVTYVTIAVVTGMAMLNIRASEKITGLFLLIEAVALFLVAGVGVAHVQPHAHELLAHPMTMQGGTWVGVGLGALALAAVNASWSVSGSSQALLFTDEMKQPRTIGRIMMLSFAMTVVLETAPVIGTIVGARDLHAVLADSAPFEEFLRQYLPDFGMKFVSVAIAVAIFNAALAGFIGFGRNVFSMGRARLFNDGINRALMRLTRKTDAPWVALVLLALTTAAVQPLSMTIKIMLLASGTTFITVFYIWGVVAGRRSGRTGVRGYRTPLYPLVPIVGTVIVVWEVAAQLFDRETGRPSLFLWAAAYAASYLYYRFVLMRRPQGWRMEGPEDIDAQCRNDCVTELPGKPLLDPA